MQGSKSKRKWFLPELEPVTTNETAELVHHGNGVPTGSVSGRVFHPRTMRVKYAPSSLDISRSPVHPSPQHVHLPRQLSMHAGVGYAIGQRRRTSRSQLALSDP